MYLYPRCWSLISVQHRLFSNFAIKMFLNILRCFLHQEWRPKLRLCLFVLRRRGAENKETVSYFNLMAFPQVATVDPFFREEQIWTSYWWQSGRDDLHFDCRGGKVHWLHAYRASLGGNFWPAAKSCVFLVICSCSLYNLEIPSTRRARIRSRDILRNFLPSDLGVCDAREKSSKGVARITLFCLNLSGRCDVENPRGEAGQKSA